MQDPEHLAESLNAMIEARRAELRGDPDKQARAWANKLAEVDQKRPVSGQAAEGPIDFDELREKLAALEETRQTVQTELAALSRSREEIEELERDRDTLLASYAEMVPERLGRLTPEHRHSLYRRLRLRVRLHPDHEPEITWAFGMGPSVSKDEQIPTGLSAAVRRICSR